VAKRLLFVGIDVGTQGTKAVAFDSVSCAIVARSFRPYDLLPGLPAGAAEQDPQKWIDAVQGVILDILQSTRGDKGDVAGIGVSGQQHGSVVLDAHGDVLRPARLWCDTTKRLRN
jgi:xylulokinase